MISIGDKKIDAVDVTDIQRLMDWMANGKVNGLSRNLTEGTISRVKGLISHLYNIALDMHLANENPVKVTLLVNKGVESSHHTALLDEEFESVKKKIPLLESLDDRVLMGLIAYTGMRPEEVRGIMWDDINMDEHYVIVKRAVTFVGRDRYAHVDTPKSETSQRTVYIPAPRGPTVHERQIVELSHHCHGLMKIHLLSLLFVSGIAQLVLSWV